MERSNVLVVNLGADEFDKVEPLLGREEFEVDRFPRARMALELIETVAFDVLIVGYPLPDIEARAFFRSVRSSDSPCRSSPLLLLTRSEDLDAARELIGYGANRVVVMEETAERLQREVTDLLEVAPRREVRTMVRLQVKVDDGSQLAMCQSENISRSGMLIRAGEAYDIGTEVSFEFFLGQQPTPLVGHGEVVRHTTPGREEVVGMGIRFTSFEKDGRKRLERFLDQQKG
ncbi:MAG: response regulator [Thermoanaerobaculia bacterium]|nr:response regulator [Thermoanaerobaculia bacterium]